MKNNLVLISFLFLVLAAPVNADINLRGHCEDSVLNISQGKLVFIINNQGTDAALNLSVRLSGSTDIISVGELKEGENKTVEIPITITDNPGSYSKIIVTNFFTKYGMSHELLFGCIAHYKQRALLNATVSVFSANIPTGKTGSIGVLINKVNEKNIKSSKLSLYVPDGFSFDAIPREFSLGSAENKTYVYVIRNHGAAPNSSYAMIVILDADVNGVHKTSVISSVVITTYSEPEVEKTYRRNPLELVILFLVILVAVYFFLKNGKKWKMKKFSL